MREIVFDTETTGRDPLNGDRLIEIGCIELHNHVPTGRQFHRRINPERDVPAEVVAVHGITFDMLRHEPVFAEVVGDLLEFLGEAVLVAHNAEFDRGFLNAELGRCGFGQIGPERVVDTLAIARRRFPGAPCSLDALCRRFEIDLSARTLHGALLDAQLLADVYLELRGGRQHALGLTASLAAQAAAAGRARSFRAPRPHLGAPTEAERAAHAAMVAQLKGSLWEPAGG